MQHAALSVFRAVENHVWMVRATNTGVSCFISPIGKIVSQIEDEKGENVWISGTLTDKVYRGEKRTFYSQNGDLFSWLMLCGVVLLFITNRKALFRGDNYGSN